MCEEVLVFLTALGTAGITPPGRRPAQSLSTYSRLMAVNLGYHVVTASNDYALGMPSPLL